MMPVDRRVVDAAKGGRVVRVMGERGRGMLVRVLEQGTKESERKRKDAKRERGDADERGKRGSEGGGMVRKARRPVMNKKREAGENKGEGEEDEEERG